MSRCRIGALLALAVSMGLVAAFGADGKDRFGGTWRLVSIERLSAQGEPLPPLAPPAFGSPNPTGSIIYDPAGYMAVTIMQSGRRKYAGAAGDDILNKGGKVLQLISTEQQDAYGMEGVVGDEELVAVRLDEQRSGFFGFRLIEENLQENVGVD